MELEWQVILEEQMRDRRDPWIVLEGRHAVEAAMAGWWEVVGVVSSEDSNWEMPMWAGPEWVRKPRLEIERIAGYPFHRGVLGLAKIPTETSEVAKLVAGLEEGWVVVIPRLADPSNVGALIRNAAAFGAKAVLLGTDAVSPFHPKAVRASAGALFRLPVRVADSGQILRCLKAGGYRLTGAESDPAAPALDEPRRQDPAKQALVIGAEDTGLGGFWKAACDRLVRIPMQAEVDSLNAAAAGAVLLWELVGRKGSGDDGAGNLPEERMPE